MPTLIQPFKQTAVVQMFRRTFGHDRRRQLFVVTTQHQRGTRMLQGYQRFGFSGLCCFVHNTHFKSNVLPIFTTVPTECCTGIQRTGHNVGTLNVVPFQIFFNAAVVAVVNGLMY